MTDAATAMMDNDDVQAPAIDLLPEGKIVAHSPGCIPHGHVGWDRQADRIVFEALGRQWNG